MSASFMTEFIPDEVRHNIDQPSLQRKFVGNLCESSDRYVINVLQWNILAQALSYSEGNFNRVKSEMVQYETRRWRILEQILIHQPDLCSLQEVDIYNCFLKEQLRKYGYECFFTEKPNSRCLSFQHDQKNFKGPDGLLLCFKTSTFKEISRNTSDLPNDGRYGRQVFSILELEYLPLSSRVVFIGTHFKAKKQFAASRTNQAATIVTYVNNKYPTSTNLIIAGDFNGQPDEPCYDVLIKSGLQSAYRTLMNNHEPAFTTWKFKSREENKEKEESATIDYIFYQPENLIPIAYLAFPEKRTIGPNGLPSATYPSDHLALQVVFRVEK
ncbi:unnamed protein product [Adineta ricciae]|uniref:Nocturnin n=1 Tax=Adineta ricciae TaxID=249248 RepID=A0A816DN67_ADIRI|nr:unnamed protein product [Adineta ricciae]CAF1635130.1 unnamed protein product [Adineta ricciae]